MLVYVALAISVLIGMMGLSVDYGFVALERRTLQKAADAAAMSGAIDLIDSTNWSSVNTDVSTVVTRNNVGAGTTTSCGYVNTGNVVVQANCNTPTDMTTSGVKVTLARTRQNYFLGVVGQSTVAVNATAIGRVWGVAQYNAGAALFIVCGYNTKVAGPGNNTYDILNPGGPPYTVKTGAIGKRYLVHGPQIADCGANNSNFKGLYGEAGLVTLPSVLHYTEGTVAGPTTVQVEGPDGCAANVTTFDGCVMVLPVANGVVGTTSDKELYAVMWLPFRIYDAGANQHEGVLVSDTYQIRAHTTSLSTWTLGTPGLVSTRMVN